MIAPFSWSAHVEWYFNYTFNKIDFFFLGYVAHKVVQNIVQNTFGLIILLD